MKNPLEFKEYLSKSIKLVDRALDGYLPSEKEEPVIINRAMRYSVFSGGKRIRPILAIETCRACGGREKDAMPAACAIELVHTYSLVHDDLPAMDDDDLRRGKPACHKVFGDANAILTGDALQASAFEIISKEMDSKIGIKVIRELSRAIGAKGMVGGQARDLEYKGKAKKTKTLNNINRLKTAKLFEASAKIGAMAAGAKPGEVRLMADFGVSLGMAFQIVDDILDKGDYTTIFGMRKARKDALDFIEKAKKGIKKIGKKGYRLAAIADYVLEKAG